MLGPLLLDQNLICGIGVAWGSEILNRAKLLPNKKACEQDLSHLYASIMYYSHVSLELYTDELDKHTHSKETLRQFINSWFKNLYEIREMKVYKKANTITVGGRTWHIK